MPKMTKHLQASPYGDQLLHSTLGQPAETVLTAILEDEGYGCG